MSKVTLRELLEGQIGALRELAMAKLSASDALTCDALENIRRSADKALAAQADYNARSNEFRAALSDQATLLMPRAEALVLIGKTGEQVAAVQTNIDNQIRVERAAASERADNTARQLQALALAVNERITIKDYEQRRGDLERQVIELKEAQALGRGKETQARAGGETDRWTIGVAILGTGLLVSVVDVVLRLLLR